MKQEPNYAQEILTCNQQDLYFNYVAAMKGQRFVSRSRLSVFQELKDNRNSLHCAVIGIHPTILLQ